MERSTEESRFNIRRPTEGYLALLLHAHLPFIRHPEYDRALEERWLFEAITECYLPLLEVFRGLRRDGIGFSITLSLSPTLAAMLADPFLQGRYLAHMQALIRLARSELRRRRAEPERRALAGWYHASFQDKVARYEACGRDLGRALATLAGPQGLELITTTATHAYLPLLRHRPTSVEGQLQIGRAAHVERFQQPPSGVWLPECGYYPGLEDAVREAGFRYFFLDSHGVRHGRPPPVFGHYTPVACHNGVAAFGRDPEASREVWGRGGFPADPWYREYHHDLARELAPDLLARDLSGFGNTGIRYYRVTGGTGHKRIYCPDRARQQADAHAAEFLARRLSAARRAAPHMDRPPLLVAPFDAELFGHWWFEGPVWLDRLFRRVHGQEAITLITPSEYLARHPRVQRVDPAISSWGEGGYHGFWLDESNQWVFQALSRASAAMQQLASRFRDMVPEPGIERTLAQAARELLLAQASDWPFMIRAGTTTAYAERRVREHLHNFEHLAAALRDGVVRESDLLDLESRTPIFPNLDWRALVGQEH